RRAGGHDRLEYQAAAAIAPRGGRVRRGRAGRAIRTEERWPRAIMVAAACSRQARLPAFRLDQEGATPYRSTAHANRLPGIGTELPRPFGETCSPITSGSASSAEKSLGSKKCRGSACTA